MNKNNTVGRGNAFEKKGFQLLKSAFEDGRFGVLPKCCKFRLKPHYKSKILGGWIEFDMSVEVRLNPKEKPIMIFLVELKDYQTTIPGNDVGEFIQNMQSIGGWNLHPIFISTTNLQPKAEKLVKAHKIVWIKVDEDSHNTKIYSSRKRKNSLIDTDFAQIAAQLEKLSFLNELSSLGIHQHMEDIDWPELIERFIRHALMGNLSGKATESSEITGVERLSGELLERMAENLLDDFNPNIRNHHLGVNAESFIDYLKAKHQLDISIEAIEQPKNREILGMCMAKEKKIIIDSSLQGTDRFAFVLAHEVAHYFLHGHLSMEQFVYDSQSDSIYDPIMGKHVLVNDRNWIEWQANKFAACLMMPQLNTVVRLIDCQSKRERRRPNHVHVNNDAENWTNFLLTIDHLSKYFGVSHRVMEYRLADMGLLTYGPSFRRPNRISNEVSVHAKPIGQIMLRALNQMEINYLQPIQPKKEFEDDPPF
ncbi:ImmA/IrrE family metallo-endopeptidase [Pedobacter psychrodurus]|uniref:ImmA/IrrE family metallo-endopeptidase n=1 Tax=Pedobacter psychrodurus TaxID=2530456 RepID=A0A4R0PZ91_9SPHI|nr:ImmA/IrrE family metallo-endopeptidase [Pedobacter psychrodurus]TCD27768.1 ImmA/IrrE family metallo-endopeptidase [Pedobacter psychrodurus]